MKLVYAPDHIHHAPCAEFADGVFAPSFEVPRRAEAVREALLAAAIGQEVEAPELDPRQLSIVHDPEYVDFLSSVWVRWKREKCSDIALPACWPAGSETRRRPKSLSGQLGFYSYDISTPIVEGTFAAALGSASVAIAAAQYVADGEAAAFGICRPPGHHASRAQFGGYCYFNNAALAAQQLILEGKSRVAILDIDYHHGNGTQSIFYDRSDVLFVSIHGDPRAAYPYFWGFAEELGHGDGLGANLNLPLHDGAGWNEYGAALGQAMKAISRFEPSALVVSAGFDAADDDPLSNFHLQPADFYTLGAEIRALGLSTIFVLEGGYATTSIGENCVALMDGFLNNPKRGK